MSACGVVPKPRLDCDEILRVAHRDAVAVYRDLSEYQITLGCHRTAGMWITT